MDITANKWNWSVAGQVALPMGMLFAVLLLGFTYVQLYRSNQLNRGQQLILQKKRKALPFFVRGTQRGYAVDRG